MPVDKAINILSFNPKKGATIIRQLLESAIANAEHNNGADIDDLKISRIFVDRASFMPRTSARAKGRGNRIMKPTCHITITVAD